VKKILAKSGIDLTAYKRAQMERRINSFMRSAGAVDYAAFVKILDQDHNVYRRFLEHLTINVSEFFRNTAHWNVLQHKILPELLEERKSLRTWSAGCSTGEEPYSLAIMLKEACPGRFETILATDIDDEALEKAARGLYSRKVVQGVPGHLLNKYFQQEGEGYFRISDEIRKLVKFQKRDLLKDVFPTDMDLILCRNVVIYFTEETKERLYAKFVQALRRKGVLFIGSTEQIFKARELGLRAAATFFYQKE